MTARLAAIALMFAAIGIACWLAGEIDKAAAAGLLTTILAGAGLALEWRGFARRRRETEELTPRVNAVRQRFQARAGAE